ncbi:hypothetical protein A7X67_01560 [Clostridium sp. W14A]|nr:hypothetical protein A7X67_01560 [Clostridium sp. W14A]
MRISKSPIDRCPHCGSTDGYYTKEQVHGSIQYMYNFDGTEADNGELYDYLNYTGGKYAYCLRCGKRLFKMEE